MPPDFYVIATWPDGPLVRLRVVAGPLKQDAAEHEARLRKERPAAAGITFVVVESDPYFAMVSDPSSLTCMCTKRRGE
jgi:hypothetical protein